MRFDLDTKRGPLTLRAYGLILNFIANAVALVGISRILAGNGGYGLTITGAIMTCLLIIVLSRPSGPGESET